MDTKEIPMRGKGEDLDWQRQVRTFMDDASLNNFLRSKRGTAFKVTKGPTQIVVGDKIAHVIEFVEGGAPQP